mmetsp:Transcript_3451/g.7173  ORF Transcript_3451/g.7173 Transcript_3451/m.7173 type:complete len:275 (+) Transcript_3451:214-1038(+)
MVDGTLCLCLSNSFSSASLYFLRYNCACSALGWSTWGTWIGLPTTTWIGLAWGMVLPDLPQKSSGQKPMEREKLRTNPVGTKGGPGRAQLNELHWPKANAGTSGAPCWSASFTKPVRFVRKRVSMSCSIVRHSCTPPGIITQHLPSFRYLFKFDLEMGRRPSHVQRCRTNATEKTALVANATRAPYLSRCFGTRDPPSAKATRPSGSTLCGSKPIIYGRSPLKTVSSSISIVTGKYFCIHFTIIPNGRIAHDGVASLSAGKKQSVRCSPIADKP